MANSHTSRRAVIGAIASLPAVAMTTPVFAQEADRGAWDQAFANYERVKAEEEAFDRSFSALCDRYEAELAAIPHVTLRPDPYVGRREPVTTADRHYVAQARKLVEDVRAGRCYLETDRYPSLAEHYRLCRQTKIAADRRDRQVRQLRARMGMDEAEERWEELGDRHYEAKWALMNLPAPDGRALFWKLNVLLDGDAVTWSEAALAPAMADARRLLNVGT